MVRIAAFHVEEEQHAKEVARSAYLPTIRNDSTFAHATDTQFIAIPAGSIGSSGRYSNSRRGSSSSIKVRRTLSASGTGLTQPLTELFKIKAGNDVARADAESEP